MLTAESDVVVMHQAVDGIDFTTNVEFAGRVVEVFHGWVSLVVCAEDFDGFFCSVIRSGNVNETVLS